MHDRMDTEGRATQESCRGEKAFQYVRHQDNIRAKNHSRIFRIPSGKLRSIADTHY